MTTTNTRNTRTLDARGRLTLGPDWAGALAIVEEVKEGVVQVTLAEAIPAREAWLHRNPKALASVRRGLEQAKAGNFVEGPDLEADAALIEEMGGK